MQTSYEKLHCPPLNQAGVSIKRTVIIPTLGWRDSSTTAAYTVGLHYGVRIGTSGNISDTVRATGCWVIGAATAFHIAQAPRSAMLPRVRHGKRIVRPEHFRLRTLTRFAIQQRQLLGLLSLSAGQRACRAIFSSADQHGTGCRSTCGQMTTLAAHQRVGRIRWV